MIAVSVKDSDAIVDLLLQKGADVNRTSKCHKAFLYHDIDSKLMSPTDHSGQVSTVRINEIASTDQPPETHLARFLHQSPLLTTKPLSRQ